jgi:outer membrane protein TolC
VTNGEAAPLDTVEALLEVVRREVQLTEASQSRLASRLMVESYLWDARGLPDSLPTNAIPVARIEHPAGTDTAAVGAIVTASLRTHPDLRRVDARIDQATALRRLASQQRMPYLATEISALGDGGGIDVTPGDDGKVGLTFRSPLLYLRERGRENAAALRVEQGMIDEERLIRDITVLVRTAAGEVEAVVRSVGLQRTVIAQASALVRGEQLRFDAGESTLFLVNARERALLEEEVRLAGLEARQLVAHGELAAASGLWLHERRDRR